MRFPAVRAAAVAEWSRVAEVVVRSIATVGNYDYIMDVKFREEPSRSSDPRRSAHWGGWFEGKPKGQPSQKEVVETVWWLTL